MDSARIIVHVDLDYFYAQCEEIMNPELREKPVVVCAYSGRTEESGAVSTANYIARQFGVRSGMPIVHAKRLLRDANPVFLPMRREIYEEKSQGVMKILRGYADRFEQTSIDEAFMDVSDSSDGSFEVAANIARGAKDQVRRTEGLTCSVGIGPNKLIAKMASDHQKPDGLTVIRPEQVTAFIEMLPTDALYGVGPKTSEKLQGLGISTVGELAKFDQAKLRDIFGAKLGVYLHWAANGRDDEPVQDRQMPEQVSRIVTLKENSRDLSYIAVELNRICSDIHEKLVRDGLSYKTVGILAIDVELRIHSRVKSLGSVADDEQTMRRTAQELLARLFEERDDIVLRRFGVKVSNIEGRSARASLVEYFG